LNRSLGDPLIEDRTIATWRVITRVLRELNEQGAYARSIVRLVDNTEYHVETSRWVTNPA